MLPEPCPVGIRPGLLIARYRSGAAGPLGTGALVALAGRSLTLRLTLVARVAGNTHATAPGSAPDSQAGVPAGHLCLEAGHIAARMAPLETSAGAGAGGCHTPL